MNRVLFEPEELERPLPTEDPRARHISSVLRLQAGDEFEVGVVNGARGRATYRGLGNEGLHLSVQWEPDAGSDLYPATALIGHPRPIVLKRLLRDLTTIGVRLIFVCGTELGEKSYLRSNLWRTREYRSLLIEGASQAGGTYLPAVERAYSVRRGIEAAEAATAGMPEAEQGTVDRLLCTDAPDAEPIGRLLRAASGGPVIFAVGNERGFTEQEQEELRGGHYRPTSLGPRILRTETAATIAAGAIVQSLGRFGR
jgi:RsmE family RNA methyltransferase